MTARASSEHAVDDARGGTQRIERIAVESGARAVARTKTVPAGDRAHIEVAIEQHVSLQKRMQGTGQRRSARLAPFLFLFFLLSHTISRHYAPVGFDVAWQPGRGHDQQIRKLGAMDRRSGFFNLRIGARW
jgi:hypothetical protein